MDGKMGEWELRNKLINELTQGRELAKLLQIQLNTPSSSSWHRGMLVEKIISSNEKALSVLMNFSSSSSTQELQPTPTGPVIESPPSLSGSPPSEDSDHDLKDPQDLHDYSKKRKTFPKWTQKVRVSPGTGLEGPLDDGFSWRKYGQKDILGAKYPRGYYRCTHRTGKGCLANKQVQRSDEDPTIFKITYRGNHTCAQSQATKSKISPPTHEPNNIIEPHQHNFYQTQQSPTEEALLNLRKDLKIVTQDLDINPQQQSSSLHSLFHFPPSASVGNISPSFISPQASGSTNYNFSASPSSGIDIFQGNQPELSEMISPGASTSATNSPTIGLDFLFGDIQYDPNFTFDDLRFFSSFQPFEKHTK